MGAPDGEQFVARERELASLRTALDRGLAGDPGLVLVVGEAGMGKTVLVDRLAAEARSRSMRVLRSDADERDRSPFGLWGGLRHLLGLAAGVQDEALSPSERRWDLLEKLAEGIAALAPALVVLEDLHWADDASRWVLERLPRELAGRSVAMVATSRSEDDVPTTSSIRAARIIRLRGFDGDELARLLDVLDGATGIDVDALLERTGGNPLFVREVVALGLDGRIPPLVGEVLSRSLARFDETVGHALAGLALAGPDTPLAVVAVALGCSPAELRTSYDQALAVAVLEESPARRVWFRHDLLADAAAAFLPADKQRRLHRDLAEAWAGAGSGGDAALAAAGHRLAAVPLEDASRAASIALAASGSAVGSGARARAAGLLVAADETLAADAAGASELRARVLVELGEAHFWLGNVVAAIDAYEAAATLAADLDDGRLLAVAEAGAAREIPFFMPDPDRRRRLSVAEHRLPVGDDPLRVVLLGRQAVLALADPDALEERRHLGDAALAMARRLGDPDLVAQALVDRHLAPADRHDLDGRDGAADELIDLGERQGRPEVALGGYEWRFAARLQRGDLLGAEDALLRLEALAAVMPSSTWRYVALLRRAQQHNLEGDRSAALEALERATEIATGVRPAQEVAGLDHVSRVVTARLWGIPDPVLAERQPLLERSMRHVPSPLIQVPLALGAVIIGDLSSARRTVERYAARPERVLHGPEGANMLSMLGALVADLGMQEQAREILALLEPYAGLLLVANGMGADLPADGLRGRLALLTGDPVSAVAHLEAAVALARRMASPILEARALHFLAEALSGLDEVAACRIGDEAAALARRIGAVLPGEASAGDGATRLLQPGPGAASASLRRAGGHWQVTSVHGEGGVAHSVGMAQLSRLLASPGTEVATTELVAADARLRPAADLGPALDGQAKRAYRARIADLQVEIDEADAFCDPERATLARLEMDALMAELRRAVGLGGRDRPSGSGAERARVNVTRNLRRAIASITSVVPALGAHLAVSVRTGRFCCYDPEPAAALEWTIEG